METWEETKAGMVAEEQQIGFPEGFTFDLRCE